MVRVAEKALARDVSAMQLSAARPDEARELQCAVQPAADKGPHVCV